MSETHYFIGIQLPAELKEYFAGWQRQLKDQIPLKTWTNPEDFHITLHFLGPASDNKIKALKHALRQIEHLPAFSIRVGDLGIFGNSNKPSVLWAGAERSQPLLNVKTSVDESIKAIGDKAENRKYQPHITLAKKWAGGGQYVSFEAIKPDYNEKVKTMHVDHISIFQIHPKSHPKYEIMQNIFLK